MAVQSHYFSVGPIVPWAESGVGAVATQSLGDAGYGPRGSTLMRAGATARRGARGELAADAARGTARWRWSTRPGTSPRTPANLHPRGRPRHRRRLQRAGQHDGARDGLAGDGEGLRGGAAAISPSAARGARGGRARGRRHPRAPVGRDPGRAGREASGQPWNDRLVRPARRGPPRAARRAAAPGATAPRLRAAFRARAPTSRRATGRSSSTSGRRVRLANAGQVERARERSSRGSPEATRAGASSRAGSFRSGCCRRRSPRSSGV